jgi:hypothetical protein
MIREKLAVKHDAGDVDAHAIHSQKQVEHGDSGGKSSFVGGFFGVRGDDGGFDDQAGTTPADAEEHEGFAPDFVHAAGAYGVEDDANCDPAALEFELLFATR